MKNYIFVDLDETLFHSRYLSSDLGRAERGISANEEMIVLDQNADENTEYYGSLLRPGAHDLLKRLRALPDTKVLVLTSSVCEYANEQNRVHNFEFDPEDIFSRENLQEGSQDVQLGEADCNIFLIDNLTRHENRIKVRFLENLTDNPVRYIKVPEFYNVKLDRHFDSALIDSILLDINNLSNS